MFKFIIPAVAALSIVACGGGQSTNQVPVALTSAQIQAVKTYMSPQYTDISKVEVRNIRGANVVASNGSNYVLVCGEINTNNNTFRPFFSRLIQNDFKLGIIAQNSSSASYVSSACDNL